MGKVKGAKHDTWSHHDTMIVNLKDWVWREINVLRTDLSKNVPHMEDDPSVLKVLKSAEDMNIQLFDLIRSIVDRAEAESKKMKKVEKATAVATDPDEDEIEG